MKKIYSVIAMAMFAMGINAQVTYDFTTVAPAPTDGGGIVNPAYGEGNTTDGDHVFSIHSKTDGADIPMVYLVAPDGTDYDKRIGIHNRGKSWVFRNTADAVWRGLWSQYNNRYLSIMDLHPGDVVSIVLSPNDSNSGFVFDDKDLDQDETGRYGSMTRAELNQALVDYYGGDPDYMENQGITEEERNRVSEQFKTVSFQIYDGITDPTVNLLLMSESGIYIEKLTIASAGEADAIEKVDYVVKGDGHWYDINGRKVDSPVKGLYIHNGKKVVLK